MRTTGGKAISNAEIIIDIMQLIEGRDVRFVKVKSHVGVMFNE